jgi:very-short-patch-repair endonuclease
MEKSRDARIAEVAERHHGVFTIAHADEVGFTRDQREFRCRVGRWVLLHDGVYRMAGMPASSQALVLAACWGAQGLAVASHRSAAEIWGLPGGRPDLVEITCRRWKRGKALGLVVHETKHIDDVDFGIVDGIPTTSIEQTLLGLGATVLPTTVEMALDRALHRKLTTIAQLETFLRRKGKRGRNGAGVLRLLVRTRGVGGASESVMETKLKQLLRRHGFPSPVFQYEIWHNGRFVARVDAAYPERKIAIEYDSYEHHTGTIAHERDNDRRNVLRRIQWQTIAFTAADIRRDGGEALETLRSALRSGAPGAWRPHGVSATAPE